MSSNRLCLFLILTLLIYAPAYAHPPYLIKQGLITDPDGNKVIKEKLYGDGLFTSDPATFQLRNRHGALLANSPINDHAFSFCPSIDFCWVFAYSFISLFLFGPNRMARVNLYRKRHSAVANPRSSAPTPSAQARPLDRPHGGVGKRRRNGSGLVGIPGHHRPAIVRPERGERRVARRCPARMRPLRAIVATAADFGAAEAGKEFLIMATL